MGVEIQCYACGTTALVRKEPRYEGFRKVGDTWSCMSCGHVFKNEADVPYRAAQKQNLFSASDLSARPDVFQSTDASRNCRHCRHYVVNPFTQRCGLHGQRVEATDVCDDFSASEAES